MNPFGAGVVAQRLHSQRLRGLDHDLGAIDMAGDHVAARVNQRLRRFRLADGKRPIAGDDELNLGRRIDFLHAHGEGIDVA